MKQFLLFCFILTFYGSLAQKNLKKIDSLVKVVAYKEALQLLRTEKEKTPNDSVSFLENTEAEILITLGNLNEAENVLSNIKISTPYVKAVTQSTTGFLNLNKGRYDLANENLQAALAAFQSTGKSNTKEAARCLANIASYYLATGKYNKAEEYETIALQLRQKLFGESSEEVAASYNNLGTIYLSSDPDRSLDYYEKALTTYQQLHRGNHPKLAIANTNIGIAYNQLELYGDAINSFDTAKKIWEQIYPDGHPNLAIVLQNIGSAYSKQKNAKVAEEFYDKAISIYTKSYGTKHPDLASALNSLGSLQLNNNEYDKSIATFQKSIVANAPSFNSLDLESNPIGSDYYNPMVLVYSINFKAKALESKYLGRSLKLNDLKIALQCIYKCDSLIDDIRHQSTDEQDKLALGNIATEVYEVGVRVAHTIGENSINPRAYFEKAFYFAEKSKSSVLLESIAETQAKSFAGIPQELLDQELKIKSSIAVLVQKLTQKPAEQEEKEIREKLFVLNNEYTSFVKKLEKDFPKYFNLKFSQRINTVSDIQNQLDATTGLISYFLAEKTNRLYQFSVTKQRFKIKDSSIPPDLNRLLKGFMNSILFSNFETYKKTSLPIAALLKPNVDRQIKELVVIPTGRLGTIPFDALPSGRIKGTNFNQVSYWLKEYAISYEFASNLFTQKGREKLATENPTIFLCAPVTFPEKDNLSQLPGTEKEVNNISQLFANSKSVKFEDATETVIKSKQISNFNYLHFATHGIVDEENPESSKIFLQTTDADDGNLYAGEIYNLELNANLAVLSACQTGLGKISKGEGVIGLSRALTYAGAKNIVVSFWSVADESTSKLMTDFYTNLLGTKSIHFNRSLQQAKLKMSKTIEYSNPFFWAPFVLLGK
jgi:CHAT domain-containing protein